MAKLAIAESLTKMARMRRTKRVRRIVGVGKSAECRRQREREVEEKIGERGWRGARKVIGLEPGGKRWRGMMKRWRSVRRWGVGMSVYRGMWVGNQVSKVDDEGWRVECTSRQRRAVSFHRCFLGVYGVLSVGVLRGVFGVICLYIRISPWFPRI